MSGYSNFKWCSKGLNSDFNKPNSITAEFHVKLLQKLTLFMYFMSHMKIVLQ